MLGVMVVLLLKVEEMVVSDPDTLVDVPGVYVVVADVIVVFDVTVVVRSL